MSKIFKVVCHFEALGIKEIKAPDFMEALQLAQSEEYEFQKATIRPIGMCQADEDLSRHLLGVEKPEEKKEYLSWGSE
jgi:hypothetical protein